MNQKVLDSIGPRVFTTLFNIFCQLPHLCATEGLDVDLWLKQIDCSLGRGFVSVDDFRSLTENGVFMGKVFTSYYADIPRGSLGKLVAEGKIVIKDTDLIKALIIYKQ